MTVPVILSVAAVVLAIVNIFVICSLLKVYDEQAKRRKESTQKMIALIEKWQRLEKARLQREKAQQQQEQR